MYLAVAWSGPVSLVTGAGLDNPAVACSGWRLMFSSGAREAFVNVFALVSQPLGANGE